MAEEDELTNREDLFLVQVSRLTFKLASRLAFIEPEDRPIVNASLIILNQAAFLNETHPTEAKRLLQKARQISRKVI